MKKEIYGFVHIQFPGYDVKIDIVDLDSWKLIQDFIDAIRKAHQEFEKPKVPDE